MFSPAFRGGLIEANLRLSEISFLGRFSPAFRGGLIEADVVYEDNVPSGLRFPLHFAGASLKHRILMRHEHDDIRVFPCISRGPH